MDARAGEVLKPLAACGRPVLAIRPCSRLAERATGNCEAVQRMQPGEIENEVKVWFSEVSFDASCASSSLPTEREITSADRAVRKTK
jgi:hypothetical protein